MTTMIFTREFTKGNLEGITHKDKMPFSSEQRGREWAHTINQKPALGQSNYLILEYRFETH